MAIQQLLLGTGPKDYEIERSIRNDQGTADTNSGSNFSRTFGASGNRKTFTKSVWVKKCNTPGNIGDDQYSIISAGGGGSGSSACNLRFSNIDTLRYGSGVSGSPIFKLWTNRKFRDPSAWYHIVVAVDTTQSTASDRAKMYINGVQETDFATADYPSQNADIYFNFDINHRIGSNSIWSNLSNTYGNFNGYIAEFNFIDGTALTPSSFGETNSKTGQWIPKKYSGSYGTNGFYLNFSDNSNTTAATLGKDSSGNGNNFTPNNFVTGDSVKDSPTNNFATLRTHSTPEASGVVEAEGNLKYTTGSTGGAGTLNRIAISTFLPTSGKWYAEVIPTSGAGNQCAGIVPYTVEETPTTDRPRYNILNFNNGDILQNLSGSGGTLSNHGDSVSTNDVVCIYMDMDAKTVYYGKNGQWADGSGNWDQSTPTSGLSLGNSFFNYKTGGHEGFAIAIMSVTGGASITCIANFGQDSTFAGTLTAGSNTDANGIGEFKHTVPANALALCTANLGKPTIALPDKHFETLLYTGNGSNGHAITGLEFQPDWLWLKKRNSTGHHGLYDSIRGVDKRLISDEDGLEADVPLASFNSNGFTFGSNTYYNNNTDTYVAWNWKAGGSASSNSDGSITSSVSANTTARFSIVSWTSTGTTGSTIGHGLGVKPDVIILKSRNTSEDQPWRVYHSRLGATKSLMLDATDAPATQTGVWNDTEPTSSVFTVGNFGSVNENTKSYIAYCFSEVAGFSKFGSYVGNGDNDGTFIFTGFRPAWIMIKMTSGNEDWPIYDNKRDPFNVGDHRIFANTNGAEGAVGQAHFDFVSNGIKFRKNKNPFNNSGSDYIYMAFAESPFKYSRAK